MAARGVPLTAAWLCVLLAALTFGAPRAGGQATSWVGDPATPGDWFDPLNWSDGVPTASTTASISNGGTAQIAGGFPAAEVVQLGTAGDGTIVQTAGTATISSSLTIGETLGSEGTYLLQAGTLSLTQLMQVRNGLFLQTGGMAQTTAQHSEIRIFSDARAEVASGNMITKHLEVFGDFEQRGGAVRPFDMNVYGAIGRPATYILNGGGITMTGGLMHVSRYGMPGRFVQNSGLVDLKTSSLYVGCYASGNGQYEMYGGEVKRVYELRIGVGTSTVGALFFQAGGTVQARDVLMEYGTYELRAGTLAVSGDVSIHGNRSNCRFIQSGGSFSVAGASFFAGGATYEISGGDFQTGELKFVGDAINYKMAVFRILDAQSRIYVSGLLTFGRDMGFSAVPGSTIHMIRTPTFANQSTDAAALAGLGNLRLVFEGGPAVVSNLEVAGRDIGPDPAGWEGNFALGTLQLGGADTGRIKLLNAFDNQPAWSGPEALYVDELVLNAGAQLDFNGLNLYFRNGGAPKRLFVGDADLDGAVGFRDYQILELNFKTASPEWGKGDFDGDGDVDFDDYTALEGNFGVVTLAGAPVPEPAALALLWAGVAWALRRRKPRTA